MLRALTDPLVEPHGAEAPASTGFMLERLAPALRLPTPAATQGWQNIYIGEGCRWLAGVGRKARKAGTTVR